MPKPETRKMRHYFIHLLQMRKSAIHAEPRACYYSNATDEACHYSNTPIEACHYSNCTIGLTRSLVSTLTMDRTEIDEIDFIEIDDMEDLEKTDENLYP
jgi:hypothetical protein